MQVTFPQKLRQIGLLFADDSARAEISAVLFGAHIDISESCARSRRCTSLVAGAREERLTNDN